MTGRWIISSQMFKNFYLYIIYQYKSVILGTFASLSVNSAKSPFPTRPLDSGLRRNDTIMITSSLA